MKTVENIMTKAEGIWENPFISLSLDLLLSYVVLCTRNKNNFHLREEIPGRMRFQELLKMKPEIILCSCRSSTSPTANIRSLKLTS